LEPGEEGSGLKGKERGRAKKRAIAERALRDLDAWLAQVELRAAAE
ncbi:MAG: hypothetical protein DIU57_008800, partial [Pseudomonadota bacterium]